MQRIASSGLRAAATVRGVASLRPAVRSFATVGDMFFTKDHEYVKVTGAATAKVGISNFAQDQLGGVVFVELPNVGDSFAKGDSFAIVESVKAASNIYAPVNLEVTGVNDVLSGTPETINESPEEEGWIAEVNIQDEAQLEELMNQQQYDEYVSQL